MTLVIRDVREHELDAVLALNNAVGPRILALDASRMRWFFSHASYFRVAEIDGVIAGFLIALRETATYASPNFLWFRAIPSSSTLTGSLSPSPPAASASAGFSIVM